MKRLQPLLAACALATLLTQAAPVQASAPAPLTVDAVPETCTSCGFQPVATILYGYPAFNEALKKELDAGTIVLGGCVVAPDGSDPRWQCTRCNTAMVPGEALNSKKGTGFTCAGMAEAKYTGVSPVSARHAGMTRKTCGVKQKVMPSQVLHFATLAKVKSPVFLLFSFVPQSFCHYG